MSANAYPKLRAELESSEKPPYGRQWEFLDAVHKQCIGELTDEQINECAHENEPFFKLVHGLPGSGKSEVLKWLTLYFEKVWHWNQGVHFAKVAL